jgi:Tfp pilus assembly protein PilO
MRNLRQFSRRERNFSFVTGIMVICALSYLFVVEPIVLRWVAAHDQAVQAEVELGQLLELVQNRDHIEREYDRLQGAVQVGRTEQDLKIALLTEADRLAQSSGLTVSSIKPTAMRQEAGLQRYTIEMQMHCEAHQFLQLLRNMQEPEHLLHTDMMSIVVSPSEPPLTVTLRLSKLAKVGQ